MARQWIRNFGQLATSEIRRRALSIVNAGLDAIETASVIESALALEGDVLRVRERSFALAPAARIFVVGVGKAAQEAGASLERLLGPRLTGGVIIGTGGTELHRLQIFAGTHPLPSQENVAATEKVVELANGLKEGDLVIVVVSGGGSAMLCWPESEWGQGRRLYHDFVRAGASIVELNTVRKHLSLVKGGGLARMLYPATVIGLVFSDVPGNHFEAVASGPTYPDATTVDDAARILEKHGCSGYDLTETPKEGRYFHRVTNIPLVSNLAALHGMAKRGRELGLEITILGDSFYDPAAEVAEKILLAMRCFSASALVLAGGEPEVKVPTNSGRGGRNQLLTLLALQSLHDNQVFIAFGSDGRDNDAAAGAIADGETLAKATRLGLDPADYLARFDAGTFFEKTGDLIVTGPTHANVSDLIVMVQLES